ncbi:unnamed protein product [Rhizoctonia solani]|uniref:DUF7918 domain-containing protein n=1 Tax=Rhizoctonia solani TaxID=456999 RepID=A0A8H2Y090_9AGAM|nr:unnamed protein product [Rhizoctonia solani]
MLLKSLGLRAYITDAAGTPLPEYQVKQTKEDSIECWIPSIEGANFEIRWEIVERIPTTAGCCSCVTPYFDGVKLTGKIASSGKGKGKLYGYPVGPSTVRLYQFKNREFTEEEDVSLSNIVPVEDLGTIRLRVGWGRKVLKRRSPHRFKDTDPNPGLVHEKLAKKGLWDAAGLGPATNSRPQKFSKLIEKTDAMPGNFLFRYASEDLLKEQGIIPTVSKAESSTKSDPLVKSELSNAGLGRKRARDTSSDVGGVDSVEDENGKIPEVRVKRRKSESSSNSQIAALQEGEQSHM